MDWLFQDIHKDLLVLMKAFWVWLIFPLLSLYKDVLVLYKE